MIALSMLPVAVAAAPATPQAALAAAMAASAAGWNAGDLDRFMGIYADDAVYVTAKGLVRGRAAIAERYRASFTAGGNTRGTLSFQPLGDRAVDATHHLLFARWTLSGATATETGMTTLLFERRRESWRIVVDHSS